jgi:hypothetical protein
MQLSITLNEQDVATAITKHIKDELGIDSDVTVSQVGNGTYQVEANAGDAKTTPTKRTRRTKEQLQQEAEEPTTPDTPLFEPTEATVLVLDDDGVETETPASLFAIPASSVFSG